MDKIYLYKYAKKLTSKNHENELYMNFCSYLNKYMKIRV